MDTNEELIERFEHVFTEYSILFKEIVTRRLNGKMSNEQYQRVKDITSSMLTPIFDMLTEKGSKKEDFKKQLDNVVDMFTDKNR